jgi:hypothetical protein
LNRRGSRPLERDEKASIGLAGDQPAVQRTGSVFPDPRLIPAIFDCVTFNAHILETGTEACRPHQQYQLSTAKLWWPLTRWRCGSVRPAQLDGVELSHLDCLLSGVVLGR